MAKMNWEKAKRYRPTQEELGRWKRIKMEKEKLKAARKKNKPVKKPGRATPKQMRFLRRNKLIKPTTTKVSFDTAHNLISKFINKDRKNGTTKNNNSGHRRNTGGTRTTKYSSRVQPLNESIGRNDREIDRVGQEGL